MPLPRKCRRAICSRSRKNLSQKTKRPSRDRPSHVRLLLPILTPEIYDSADASFEPFLIVALYP